VAYATAVVLARATAYFSIGGLVELIPAQAEPVAVLGELLEATKLVITAFLAASWRTVGDPRCPHCRAGPSGCWHRSPGPGDRGRGREADRGRQGQVGDRGDRGAVGAARRHRQLT